MVSMKSFFILISISVILIFGAAHNISAQDSTLIVSEPESMNELNSIVTKLLIEERFDESLFYLDKILAIEPNNIKALTSKAAALSNLGEYANALELYNKALSIDKDNAEIERSKARLLSITPTVSSNDLENNDVRYDIHLRVTVRNASGELVAVIEDSHGRYMPTSFTDYVFDQLFEKEIVEINNQKFEVLTYETVQNIAEKNDTATTGFTFSPIKSGSHEVIVFHIYTTNLETELGDKIFVEWTIVRQSI